MVKLKNESMQCFTLSSLADKIKLDDKSDVPNEVNLRKINDYLEKDQKSMLFFYFSFKCMKVHCNLNNPQEKKLYQILMCDCNRLLFEEKNIEYQIFESF